VRKCRNCNICCYGKNSYATFSELSQRNGVMLYFYSCILLCIWSFKVGHRTCCKHKYYLDEPCIIFFPFLGSISNRSLLKNHRHSMWELFYGVWVKNRWNTLNNMFCPLDKNGSWMDRATYGQNERSILHTCICNRHALNFLARCAECLPIFAWYCFRDTNT